MRLHEFHSYTGEVRRDECARCRRSPEGQGGSPVRGLPARSVPAATESKENALEKRRRAALDAALDRVVSRLDYVRSRTHVADKVDAFAELLSEIAIILLEAEE